MNNAIIRPAFVTDEHIEFLNDLRESGTTNMFGAVPYIQDAFPELTRQQSSEVLKYWMDSF